MYTSIYYPQPKGGRQFWKNNMRMQRLRPIQPQLHRQRSPRESKPLLQWTKLTKVLQWWIRGTKETTKVSKQAVRIIKDPTPTTSPPIKGDTRDVGHILLNLKALPMRMSSKVWPQCRQPWKPSSRSWKPSKSRFQPCPNQVHPSGHLSAQPCLMSDLLSTNCIYPRKKKTKWKCAAGVSRVVSGLR